MFFRKTFLIQKNQICFFTAFQSIEYFLINEMWCNYFHFIIFEINLKNPNNEIKHKNNHDVSEYNRRHSNQILNIIHQNNPIIKLLNILFFYLIKIWLVAFYQFKINTHWNHVRNIGRMSQNFSDFVFWYRLKWSIFFNVSCLHDVQFFNNPFF